jgi:hypothetical protein
MFFNKANLLFVAATALAFFSCQQGVEKSKVRIPGIYHIRIELGNHEAGKEDEIYLDHDSTNAKQTLNHFVYDSMDSITFNKTYQIDNAVMDSMYVYAVATIRNEHIFEYNKYAPTDGHYVFLEVIANEKMIQCSYSNIKKPSIASPDLGNLIRLINSSTGENPPLIK